MWIFVMQGLFLCYQSSWGTTASECSQCLCGGWVLRQGGDRWGVVTSELGVQLRWMDVSTLCISLHCPEGMVPQYGWCTTEVQLKTTFAMVDEEVVPQYGWCTTEVQLKTTLAMVDEVVVPRHLGVQLRYRWKTCYCRWGTGTSALGCTAEVDGCKYYRYKSALIWGDGTSVLMVYNWGTGKRLAIVGEVLVPRHWSRTTEVGRWGGGTSARVDYNWGTCHSWVRWWATLYEVSAHSAEVPETLVNEVCARPDEVRAPADEVLKTHFDTCEKLNSSPKSTGFVHCIYYSPKKWKWLAILLGGPGQKYESCWLWDFDKKSTSLQVKSGAVTLYSRTHDVISCILTIGPLSDAVSSSIKLGWDVCELAIFFRLHYSKKTYATDDVRSDVTHVHNSLRPKWGWKCMEIREFVVYGVMFDEVYLLLVLPLPEGRYIQV